MSSIVTNSKDKHIIRPYEFKDLQIDESDSITHIHSQANSAHKSENLNHTKEGNVLQPDYTQITTIDKSKQELLDKLEILNGGLNDVKGEIISHKESIKSHFEVESKQSYDSGYLAGKNEILEEMSKKDTDIKSRLIESISMLENEKKSISTAIEAIETELIKASFDIASEVIKVEVSKNHQQIATNLAKELIKEVKKATSITIKVSSEDYDMVSKNITDDDIKVEVDRALAIGGIMVLSDIGNIDGTIKERFIKIKSSICE
jgi:flagellar assembly protein FliH